MFIAFDLDGTLADPSEGITNGINHTLKTLDKPQRPTSELLKYIGPPTEWIFSDVLQTRDAARVMQAREIFTEFYRTEGFRQNNLYPESLKIIAALNQSGHHLTVVTSKSDSGAKAVAGYFDLQKYFRGVYGRVNDRDKTDSLSLAMASSDQRPAVMVGDRKYDVEAGKACGCVTVAVTYGFGTLDELQQTNPDYIVDSQSELLAVLTAISQFN
ncbi:MAG: HAD-IA family hydrolase [Deltaproteobacteria bacterium]|nr:HAD-IA family hydrolase [Deltaproteobacteria bacterium]